jgi:hypothetical protein
LLHVVPEVEKEKRRRPTAFFGLSRGINWASWQLEMSLDVLPIFLEGELDTF